MASLEHTASAGSVTHVLLAEVSAERYDAILHDTAADARRFAAAVSGLLKVEIYGTDDRTRILVISEWVDDVAWGKAQWDADMQDAVVARFTAARWIHSKLYRRIAFDTA